MMCFRQVMDISLLWGHECAIFPGDALYERTVIGNVADGDPFTESNLALGAHYGTHLDAPAHFIAGGRTIDSYQAAAFLLDAVVVEAGGKKDVAVDEIARADIRPGDAVLFKTENSRSGLASAGRFTPDFACIDEQGAALLVERGARLAGIDYLSIERPENPEYPVHRLLLGAGVLILEGLNLARVEPGRYLLSCLPLPITGAEASPVRAVLLR